MNHLLATVLSAALNGVDGYLVRVEVDSAQGLPHYQVVGLPDAAVRESRERISSAIRNLGFTYPTRRITINLAPAGLRKEGAAFDLPIAIGILLASEQLRPPVDDGFAAAGELSLDGSVKPIRGALCLGAAAHAAGVRRLIVPAANAAEAAHVSGLHVHGVRRLDEAARLLAALGMAGEPEPARPAALRAQARVGLDLGDVRGQERAKRALEVAAAGAHNLLFIGPPGAGKTMLARRLPGILPPLTLAEAVEATKIASVAGMLPAGSGLLAERPFRAPHHTISTAGLVGGGQPLKPGEVSLAHHGVLFLDELPEFRRSALEVLRQPLEEGQVTIVRVAGAVTFPARFTLVGASNPCPCGYRGDGRVPCRCGDGEVRAYLNRLSGPLLDRIDLQVEVGRVSPDDLLSDASSARAGESARVRARVLGARERAGRRFAGEEGVFANAQLGSALVRRHCIVRGATLRLLTTAAHKLALTARSLDRVLKVARTIADLDATPEIAERHLAEALQYRGLERAWPPAES